MTLRLLLFSSLALLVAGCANKFASAPLADGLLTESLGKAYSEQSLDEIYKRGGIGKAQRNIEINKLLTLSDNNYQEFRNNFYSNNSWTQVGFDWLSLGLSTAGALTTGGAAPILSGVSAAVQGAQGKFNSRFFLEKTTEALVNSMDTLRANKKELIVKKMANLSIQEYSTEEGVRDVLDYHAAGSLISALSQISADSGKAKENAVNSLMRTEQNLANVRSGVFSHDRAAEVLRRFWFPDGISANFENERRLREWLDGKGLKGTPLRAFVDYGQFAEMRLQAIEELDITDE